MSPAGSRASSRSSRGKSGSRKRGRSEMLTTFHEVQEHLRGRLAESEHQLIDGRRVLFVADGDRVRESFVIAFGSTDQIDNCTR